MPDVRVRHIRAVRPLLAALIRGANVSATAHAGGAGGSPLQDGQRLGRAPQDVVVCVVAVVWGESASVEACRGGIVATVCVVVEDGDGEVR